MEIENIRRLKVSYRGLMNRYIQKAKVRGIKFKISFALAKNLFSSKCHYCGVEPEYTHNVYITKSGNLRSGVKSWMEDATIKYNGIDRVDNNKSYTKGNVVACCATCNYAKRNLSKDEFFKWIKRICKKWSNL